MSEKQTQRNILSDKCRTRLDSVSDVLYSLSLPWVTDKPELNCLHNVTRKFLPRCLNQTMRRTDHIELNELRKTVTPGANSKRGKMFGVLN
jgi:hypothetical protein